MKIILRLIFALLLTVKISSAATSWETALQKMPLGNVTELNRTNCIPLMLHAFQSNDTVKALIFMPGATDEIYFFRRAHATLTNSSPTLLDAVNALTQQTHVQVKFIPPLLLFHSTEDFFEQHSKIENKKTAAALRNLVLPEKFLFSDTDWDGVLFQLNGALRVKIAPEEGSTGSWHFYRNSWVANNLTGWEMLEVLALADKTTYVVKKNLVEFQPDSRYGTAAPLEKFPF